MWLLFRIIAILFLGGVLALMLWNITGPVSMADVSEKYIGHIREGRFAEKKLKSQGVKVVQEWIETRTYPTWKPSEIAWHQLWYNAMTSGYELKIYMEPGKYDGSLRQYAIYQTDDVIFLRTEFSGKNRVLKADFTAPELEDALAPYVMDR